jgi:hypothetical protein
MTKSARTTEPAIWTAATAGTIRPVRNSEGSGD